MNNDKQIMFVEVTDTFGGEANYSWVKRYQQEIDCGLTDLQIVRRAKKLSCWNGVRCNTEYYGDEFTLRPVGICQIMFISFVNC